MSDDAAKPLICVSTAAPIRAGTRLGRLMGMLHGQRAVYHLWYGAEPRRELLGRGNFSIEIEDGHLRCRIFGEMFKPTPFEFAFHVFWLTRRGMIRTAFDLAEHRPPERRNAAESFIHFETLRDESVRKEAKGFLQYLASRR